MKYPQGQKHLKKTEVREKREALTQNEKRKRKDLKMNGRATPAKTSRKEKAAKKGGKRWSEGRKNKEGRGGRKKTPHIGRKW